MPDYRVYFLDAEDHIFAVDTLAAPSDDAVIADAENLCGRQPQCVAVEIWERARRVHRVGAATT